MKNVYDNCPVLENDKWLLRLVEKDDTDDLLSVYGDKKALPYFNSDNCHGDNFYYPTKEKMASAVDFWIYSYNEKYFVRWTIVDKATSKAIGTIEMFHRPSNGDFGEVGVIRLDVGSDYENEESLRGILSVIIPPAYELFDCNEIISKVPIYAVEREKAFLGYGFKRTDTCLVGENGYAYNGYCMITK